MNGEENIEKPKYRKGKREKEKKKESWNKKRRKKGMAKSLDAGRGRKKERAGTQ